MESPKTLQEAIVYFANFDNCKDFLTAVRWPDGVVKCPSCGSQRVTFLAKARSWKCYEGHARAKFTLKTRTIMEDSPISLDKWLAAMWLVVNCKNGVSSCEVARDLGITQKTAWFLNHRISMALHNGSIEKLSGHVEADETFIGGKARNMHVAERKRRITGTGGKDKTAVMGRWRKGQDYCGSEPQEVGASGRSQKALRCSAGVTHLGLIKVIHTGNGDWKKK